MRMFKLALLALSMALIPVLGVFPLAGSAISSPSAVITATSGQIISGPVNATGYDVGIYIGPDVHDVIVTGATVTGAGWIGILVQDASDIVIKGSTISDNGVSIVTPNEYKGIVLAGTTNCLVKDNTLEGNHDGGISVLDDGPNQPFLISGISTPGPTAGTGNVITGNTIADNVGGCGIVVSGKNADAGVSDTVVSKNTVKGFNPSAGDFIPGVGGIVLGTGSVAASTITNTIILNNEADGGFIAGIAVHCFGDGVISGTQIIGNMLSNNGPPGNGTGIEFLAAGPFAVITQTQVLHNTISDTFHITGVNTTTDTHVQPKNQ